MKKYFLCAVLCLMMVFVLPANAFAAIAFDSNLDPVDAGTGTSHAMSFTNTSGNVVIVGVLIGNTSIHISNMEYGGVAMTATPESPLNTGGGGGGNEQMWMYWITNAPTGVNSITFNTDSSVDVNYVEAVSYRGASVIQPDNHTDTLATSTADLNLTLNTVADNSWLVGFWRNAYEAVSAGSGTIFRSTTNLTVPMGDSSGPQTPAGSITISAHDSTAARDWSGLAMSIAPGTSTPVLTGSGTTNFLAKFTSATNIGNSLFSDDGSNMTLTSGNLFLPISSIIDAISSGALNFGTSLATTMTFGRAGQSMVVNSSLNTATTTTGALKASSISTVSNCASNASPAVCGSASAGSVALPNGGSTLTVDTTAVTPNSQIMVTEDSSLGTRLGVTCNTTTGRSYTITTRTATSSFVIKSSGNPATHPACLSYLIVN